MEKRTQSETASVQESTPEAAQVYEFTPEFAPIYESAPEPALLYEFTPEPARWQLVLQNLVVETFGSRPFFFTQDWPTIPPPDLPPFHLLPGPFCNLLEVK
ncbi:DNA-directed RNA polymerase subunit beta' [Labeo rohita]|uniref:DNA-directed RNA polymerase subunit beta n=1 Tax=Labeo rohita TaxID=84645 RepID=A0ABQ8ME39_LABRO|nr:DNA-directed RNA polymerase subunit beta' [Labeo rohita]